LIGHESLIVVHSTRDIAGLKPRLQKDFDFDFDFSGIGASAPQTQNEHLREVRQKIQLVQRLPN